MIANRVYVLAIMAAIVFATPLPAQTDAINQRALVSHQGPQDQRGDFNATCC